jgi:serine/threonine-protein kinase
MMTDESQVLNGRYRLLDVVGEGGMAVVWRAEDVLLGRTVAIKMLRGQFAADPDFLERFRSEARAVAALNDPGIVAVYDVGNDGSRHYLVMEYVPGPDLKSVIRSEAPLAPSRAVRIGTTLARAVAAAHNLGLVHRDLKPQNVLVTPDGRMKVADFGIARAVAAVGNTAPGVVLGTVHYLSPEQATGGPATFASDVYALGVVLYEMLAGRVPFEADSAVGVAMKIAHEAPEPLGSLNPKIPAVLVGIVDRAMARDPAARYPDAGALAEALDSYARWSEQATMGVAAARPREGAPALAGAGAARAAGPPSPVSRTQGPLFDWTGLLLGLVALAAVAGLVPLWLAVAVNGSAGGQATDGPPTVTPTATHTPEPQLSFGPGLAAGETVLVPDVVNLSESEAKTVLTAQGLSTTSEFTDTQGAQGTVAAQQPAAGTQMTQPGVVKLIVHGRPTVSVPPQAGDFVTMAEDLERIGLVPVRVDRWGGTEGAVLGLEPAPGSRLPAGSRVSVIVNSGSWLPLGVDFAERIHLAGATLDRDQVPAGQALEVVARWEAGLETIAGDYVARLQLLNDAGEAVATVERTPGDRPTNTWQSGEVFASDRFGLTVPPELPPGVYRLALRLDARADPAQPLGVQNAAWAEVDGSRVLLRQITVTVP